LPLRFHAAELAGFRRPLTFQISVGKGAVLELPPRGRPSAGPPTSGHPCPRTNPIRNQALADSAGSGPTELKPAPHTPTRHLFPALRQNPLRMLCKGERSPCEWAKSPQGRGRCAQPTFAEWVCYLGPIRPMSHEPRTADASLIRLICLLWPDFRHSTPGEAYFFFSPTFFWHMPCDTLFRL